MSKENGIAAQAGIAQGGEAEFFLPRSHIVGLIRDLRRVNASVAIYMDRIEVLSPQSIWRPAEEQELTTANDVKDRIMLQLLQARATGAVSFPIQIRQYEEEEVHEYSHNTVTFHLPDSNMIDDEPEIFPVRAGLHFLASVSEGDTSQTIQEAILKGRSTYVEPQPTNGYLGRTLAEIEDIEKDQQLFFQNGLVDRATELENLRTKVAGRLLTLRAAASEDMTLIIRVGEIIDPTQPEDKVIEIRVISREKTTRIHVNTANSLSDEFERLLPQSPDFVEQKRPPTETSEELSMFVSPPLPAYPRVDAEKIMSRWRTNTEPIYRFSNPDEAYDSGEVTPWVRLLPQNLPRLVDEVLIGDVQASGIFFDYWQERLTRFFSARTQEDYDDLAQMTLTRISNALPAFENRGEGTFSGQLHSYCYAVARSTYKRYIDARSRELRTSEFPERERAGTLYEQDYDSAELEEGGANWEMFWGRVQDILPARQWQIVDQLRTGSQNIEVMRNLEMGLTEYRREIRDARQAIADHLLTPAGLKPIDSPEFSELSNDTLKNAARVGSMDGIKILDRWYTTDSAFSMLLWKRQRLAPVAETKVARRQPTNFNGAGWETYQAHKLQVREMAAQGLTIDEMAVMLGRHFNVVKRTLARMRKEGEVIEVKRPITEQQQKKDYSEFDKQVKSLRDRGMKNEDVAVTLHTSITSVTRSVTRLQKQEELERRKPFGR
jgi:DNA-directed RNA polymerase specialized sigma24 family protein/transposase